MTKETKLRAKLDRQIAKGSPKAYKTLDKLLRMNEAVCKDVEVSKAPLWDKPDRFTLHEYITRHDNMQNAVDQSGGMTSGLAAMARRDQCGSV